MKLNRTKSEKFKDSLKKYGSSDNRPMIRDCENKELDAIVYEKKANRIRKMKEDAAKLMGVNVSEIGEFYTSHGCISSTKEIKGWTKIGEE